MRTLAAPVGQLWLTDTNPKIQVMKIQPQQRNSFAELWRRIFRRSARSHDPLLTLNMTLFNYTDGWSRTISKDEYGRSWA
jgi:hypothetical protein